MEILLLKNRLAHDRYFQVEQGRLLTSNEAIYLFAIGIVIG